MQKLEIYSHLNIQHIDIGLKLDGVDFECEVGIVKADTPFGTLQLYNIDTFEYFKFVPNIQIEFFKGVEIFEKASLLFRHLGCPLFYTNSEGRYCFAIGADGLLKIYKDNEINKMQAVLTFGEEIPKTDTIEIDNKVYTVLKQTIDTLILDKFEDLSEYGSELATLFGTNNIIITINSEEV